VKKQIKKADISIFGALMLLSHLIINQITPYPISIYTLIGIQAFFFGFLIFVMTYMSQKKKKDAARLWVDYLFIVTLKFFIFLIFIFFLKKYLGITKSQALPHIFLWFFLYLFYEVKTLINKINT